MQKGLILGVIIKAAEAYHKNYENRAFLFVGYKASSKETVAYEVKFRGFNFMHLTGVVPTLTGMNKAKDRSNAQVFYNRCLSKKLSPNDFEIKYSVTQLKIQVLKPTFNSLYLNAEYMGDYNQSGFQLETDKLVGCSKASVGFTVLNDGKTYMPNTVLKKDISKCITGRYRVAAVYRKSINNPRYTECVFISDRVDPSLVHLPVQYAYLSNLPMVEADGIFANA